MARGGTAKRVASNRNRGSRAAYAFTEKAVHCRCQPFLGGWGARIKHGRINGWMGTFGGVLRVSETLFVDSSSTSRCVWGKPEEGPQRGREEIWLLVYGVHTIPTRRPIRTKYLVYSVHFGPRQTVTALLYNLPVANIAMSPSPLMSAFDLFTPDSYTPEPEYIQHVRLHTPRVGQES